MSQLRAKELGCGTVSILGLMYSLGQWKLHLLGNVAPTGLGLSVLRMGAEEVGMLGKVCGGPGS